MPEKWKEASRFWQLLLAFTEKEIKGRYKKALLGFFWIFLNPLLQMGVIGFVFAFIFQRSIANYFLFVLSGLLPWNFFSVSVDYATVSLTANRDLVKKSRFPKAVLPLSVIVSNLNNFLISIAVVTLFLLVTQQIANYSLLLLLPIIITWQVIFTTGLVLITSALHPFFRDVSFIVRAGLQIWFYATPIIYPLSIIPKKFMFVYWINPNSGIILAYQKVFANSNFPFTEEIILLQILLTLITFVFGVIIFRKKEGLLTDWL